MHQGARNLRIWFYLVYFVWCRYMVYDLAVDQTVFVYYIFCRYVVYDLAVDPTGQTLFSCSMDGIYR